MIALFGGSFNPPHLGHLESIINAAIECEINRVGFLPCKVSPLKKNMQINDAHRLAMLSLLCDSKTNNHVELYIDETELSLPSPSYTVNTLRVLRARMPSDMPLNFFLGEDSLYTLHKWKEWQSLIQYCNIVVMPRANQLCVNSELLGWINKHSVQAVHVLKKQAYGCIYICHSPLITISSSELRQQFAQHRLVESRWIPQPVLNYIHQHKLYKHEL